MVATTLGVVLAHQGGWDEILMVVGPLALLAVVLRTAKRRADRLIAEQQAQPAARAESSADPGAEPVTDPSAPRTPPAP